MTIRRSVLSSLHATRSREPELSSREVASPTDDPDADALSNEAEEAAGTDPHDADTADDGLLDGEEVGTGTFAPRMVITNQSDGAYSVRGGDLDGDGTLDLLAASTADDTIRWYQNSSGLGLFASAHVISTQVTFARDAVPADLDGDGDLDVLAVSEGDDEILWFENTDGAGTFGSAQGITTLAANPRSAFAADLDGDGDLDVLSTSWDDDEVAWYENLDCQGTFGPEQVITSPMNPYAVSAADLDGDGDADVLSGSLGDVAWNENLDGLGNFGTRQVISTQVVLATSVTAADVDGDGDPDLVVSSLNDDTVSWFANTDGGGNFGTRQAITTQADGATFAVASDVDGDGDLDVVSSSQNDDAIAWYENANGVGTLWTEHVVSTVADGARMVFAGDLDGDGNLDVLSASANDDVVGWHVNVTAADPLDPDSDDDGLLDGVETNTGVFVGPGDTGSDPLDSDTDGDGWDDGIEVLSGTDPNDALDFPAPSVTPLLGPGGLAALALLLAAGGWRWLVRTRAA